MTEIRVDSEITLTSPGLPDADLLFELIDANREHLGRWLPGLAAVESVEEEREWLQEQIDGTGSERPMLIVVDGDIVGVIGVVDARAQNVNNVAEIGYWLIEGQQGRGITTRSCAAVVDDLIRGQGMNRIVIKAAVDNTRSRAVPERLGFVHEGVERQGIKLADGYVDLAVYSMLASEWRGAEEMGFVDPTGRPLTFGAPPILVDNGMMLRRPRVEDSGELFTLLNSNQDRLDWWSAWATRLRSREDAEGLIRTSITRDDELGSPLFVYDSGSLVGAVSIETSAEDGDAATADVRYWVGGQWEGRGLMIRACQAAVDAAIAHFELQEVTIRTGAGNMRARSLAERLGLSMLRLDRGASATEDVIVYSVSAEDWASNASTR